jgi:nucleotide-binding universal stress UspA family protein
MWRRPPPATISGMSSSLGDLRSAPPEWVARRRRELTAIAAPIAEPPTWLESVFDRILCDVDGTESSRVAVAHAARLLSPGGVLELISVADAGTGNGNGDGPMREDSYERAQEALHAGLEWYPSPRSLLVFGDHGEALASAALRTDATLVAVGARAGDRSGRPVDAVAAHLLRYAHSSVLVARPTGDELRFPRSILVGLDGSSHADAGATVAAALAAGCGAALRTVEVDGSVLRLVGALVSASAGCDLLVVGSRGADDAPLLGRAAQGVPELAHCSVLVVREPPPEAAAREA